MQRNKEEKEAVTDENKEKFWSAGLCGSETAKQLLDTIYVFYAKMFSLHGRRKKMNWQCTCVIMIINCIVIYKISQG